jgi:hexosaminidase
VTDTDSMYRRLDVLSRNLEYLGLEHRTASRRMLERIEGDDMPPELLDTLAGAVEPVKEYDREKTQKYDVEEPLNHLVDAIPPESDMAREINALAQRAVHDPVARRQLRLWFVRWQENDARLQPYLATSALRKPLVPLSQALSELGTLGLSALDSVEAVRPVTPEVRKQQFTHLEEMAAPHAEMILVVTPAVRALIEAEPGAQ